MKACVLHSAEDIRVEEWDQPVLGPDQVRIRFGAGGICGSDLHYYFEGRVGDFVVREPFVLGHEMAGDIVELGSAVEDLEVGQRVTVNPSLACGDCRFCRMERENHCENMRFLGSASLMPHVQGAFQELLTVRASQCFVVPDRLSYEVAACAEPLSVALHAVAQAGGLLGRSVLVTGSGPIGALVVIAARLAGAASITVTDLAERPLAVAAEVGADETIRLGGGGDKLADYKAGKGHFDAAFEASGSPAALADCVGAVRAAGRIVQIGMMAPGGVAVPVNRVMAKELELVGSFRFHEEFAWAVRCLVEGAVDVAPLLSASFHVSNLDAAFRAARDRERNMKVHIHF
jgi:L-idonate 5-dehydrogenase